MRCTYLVHNLILIDRSKLTLGASLDFALSTVSFKGRANIMTMSWHTMIDLEPPIVGCVISNRNYSFSVLFRIPAWRIRTWTQLKPRTGCGA